MTRIARCHQLAILSILAFSSVSAQQTDTTVRLSAARRAPRITEVVQYRQPDISPEATAALDELSQRYAAEAQLIQGWFRDRTVLYYDFGVVPMGVAPARVLWPIHGFDTRGNPVAIRGQRPIFTTLPRLGDYSGLWRITYVVTADKVQPNSLRDTAGVSAAVRARRAYVRESDVIVNLPLVPRGTTLARDTTAGMLGWFEGHDVQFFDFGAVGPAPVPMWRFARGRDAAGAPNVLADQNSIVDSVPVSPGYPDVWAISIMDVDSTYVANSLKSATAVQSANLRTASAGLQRNLPIVSVDGAAIVRVPSPIRMFSDLRSPFPPRPTPPQ
jgi:hypothetical protein